MSDTKNNGGPAFPRPGAISKEGMTLRDKFADSALVALVTEPPWTGTIPLLSQLTPDSHEVIEDRYAKAAYKMADAMLRAREK